MAELLASLVGLVAGGAVLALVHWWHSPALRQRALLNFRDPKAPSVEGVLWRRHGRWLVVRDAVLIEGPGHPRPIDGELLIDTERLLFIQYAEPRRTAAPARKDLHAA